MRPCLNYKLKIFIFAFMTTLVLGGCAKDKGIAPVGETGVPNMLTDTLSPIDPSNLAELQSRYAQGVVHPTPWLGYWWPYTASGIANSGNGVWRDEKSQGPADKYDEAYIRYLKKQNMPEKDYERLASWERARHGPGLVSVASWWGHCNGWAAAALMVPEPREAKLIEGVKFEVRDQKALLTESWMEFSGDFVGNRVNDAGDFSSGDFWDVVPAQFHLLLTNVVGRQNRGLILDRYTGDEVWNQPLVAYAIDPILKADYLGAHPDYPGIYRVNVTARIWWANDNVAPDSLTPEFDLEKMLGETNNELFPGRVLRYELWLDAPAEFDESGKLTRSGNILVTRVDGAYVGGVWKNGVSPAALVHSHPDYMWTPYGLQTSSGYKNPRLDDIWVKNHISAFH